MSDYRRFKQSVCQSYSDIDVMNMSDEELIEKIDESKDWDIQLMREVCYRVGMIEEWEDSEDFEEVYYKALSKL